VCGTEGGWILLGRISVALAFLQPFRAGQPLTLDMRSETAREFLQVQLVWYSFIFFCSESTWHGLLYMQLNADLIILFLV
jgi:hypothetical protein